MLFGGIGSTELLILLVLAVILFGRNLPQVARSVGSSYQQLRKGFNEIQQTWMVDDEPTKTKRLPHYRDSYDQADVPPAPRFEPPNLSEQSVETPDDGNDQGDR